MALGEIFEIRIMMKPPATFPASYNLSRGAVSCGMVPNFPSTSHDGISTHNIPPVVYESESSCLIFQKKPMRLHTREINHEPYPVSSSIL